MGKKEALEVLRTQLVKNIRAWLDANCESEEWLALDSYVGENAALMMSVAAMAVLAGIIDVQDYLKSEDVMVS